MLASTLLVWLAWRVGAANELTGRSTGDLLLGALFPVHPRASTGLCNERQTTRDGVFSLEAFFFSLDAANERLRRCCGFELGAVAVDTCMSERVGLQRALQFVLPRLTAANDSSSSVGAFGVDVVGVVGPMSSTVVEQVANLLGMFQVPQISYMGTSSTLSDEDHFPFLVRTVPSDEHQASALAKLLLHLNLTYVVVVYEDSTYGLRGFHEFENAAHLNGICFGDIWKVDIDDNRLLPMRLRLRKYFNDKRRARGIVLYATEPTVTQIWQAAAAEDLGDHFIWIGTDGWGNRYVEPGIREVAVGAIATTPVFEPLPGFADYFFSLSATANERNPWFGEFWQQTLGCSLRGAGASDCRRRSLRAAIDDWEFGYMHFVQEAVQAYSEALAAVHAQLCPGLRGVCAAVRRELSDPTSRMLLERLKAVTFVGSSGNRVYFKNGRDGRPLYHIVQFKRLQNPQNFGWQFLAEIDMAPMDNSSQQDIKLIGLTNAQMHSQCGLICPEGQVRRYESDKCCWSCVNCPFLAYKYNETDCRYCYTNNMSQKAPFFRPNGNKTACIPIQETVIGYANPVVLAVVTLAGIGITITVLLLLAFVRYLTTPVIKAAGRELTVVLLGGVLLGFVTVFVVALRPSVWTCAFVRVAFGLSFTACYAAIFVKTNRIVRIFQLTEGELTPCRLRHITPASQMLAVALIIGVQCLLSAIWVWLRPPAPDYRVERDEQARYIAVYRFCEALEDEDMLVALLIPGLLLALSAVYAFKARKCPGQFNETKYILITTCSTCTIWVAFLPVFFATARVPTRLFALCVALTLNSAVTLASMVVPKLYVAVCRPHKNTRETVMGRKTTLDCGSLARRNSASQNFSHTIIGCLDGDVLRLTGARRRTDPDNYTPHQRAVKMDSYAQTEPNKLLDHDCDFADDTDCE